jgi:hypothetical protein
MAFCKLCQRSALMFLYKKNVKVKLHLYCSEKRQFGFKIISKVYIFLPTFPKKHLIILSIKLDFGCKKKVMFELVELLSWSNLLELRSDHIPGQICQPGVFRKEMTIFLVGAEYIFKNNMSLTNSII